MKKYILPLSLCIIIAMTATVSANDTYGFTKRSMLSIIESPLATATFYDSSHPGKVLLSVSSSPEASIILLDRLSWFCSILQGLPGCDYVDIGEKFYRYVDKNMQVQVSLYDAANPSEQIWSDVMSDGDIIYLGNDHPNGYIIKASAHHNIPFVSLSPVDNISLH